MRHFELTYPGSLTGKRIRRGSGRPITVLPSFANPTAAAAFAYHDKNTRDFMERHGEGAHARLLVCYDVERKPGPRGCYRLRQPRIVGLFLPRAPGEPLRYLPWGPRARAMITETTP